MLILAGACYVGGGGAVGYCWALASPSATNWIRSLGVIEGFCGGGGGGAGDGVSEGGGGGGDLGRFGGLPPFPPCGFCQGGDAGTVDHRIHRVGNGDELLGSLIGSGTVVRRCSASARLVLDGCAGLLHGGGVVATVYRGVLV